MSRGLLHCLFNAKNSEGSVFGLIELWESVSSDNNKYHLDLSGVKLNILRQLFKTLSQGPVRRSLLSLIYYTAFSIPTYATKLGVDPQADFAHRPESQGLLGTTVLCLPSGASRVLD